MQALILDRQGDRHQVVQTTDGHAATQTGIRQAHGRHPVGVHQFCHQMAPCGIARHDHAIRIDTHFVRMREHMGQGQAAGVHHLFHAYPGDQRVIDHRQRNALVDKAARQKGKL